jgi:hypothetical protein
MRLKRWLSLRGRFGGGGVPAAAGLEDSGIPDVARLLVRGLRDHAVDATSATEREGWAYDFGGRFADATFECIVASTDEVRPFVVSIEMRHEHLGWLVGRRPDLVPILQHLCEKAHTVLSADPRVEEVRWYTDDAWETDPDHAWTKTP